MPISEIYDNQSFSSFMLLAGVRFRTTIVWFWQCGIAKPINTFSIPKFLLKK